MKNLKDIDYQRPQRPVININFQLIDIAHERILEEMNRANLLLEQQPNQNSQHKKKAVEDFIEGMNDLIEHDYKRLKEAFE